MLTLQILDRGQTFLYSPTGEPVVLGSGEQAGLRLGEDGVAALHARIEPRVGGLCLVAMQRVLVNGRAVDRIDLELGDRIEIGKAVLVVGHSLARPARPEDVLDSPRARSRQPRKKRSLVPLVGLGIAVLGVAVLAMWNGGDERQVESDLRVIAEAREAGDLERAQRHLADCRLRWSGSSDHRLQRLEEEKQKLTAIVDYAQQLEHRVLEPASGTYATWLSELQRLEAEGEPHQRIAARMARSSLYATMQRRPAATGMPAGNVPVGSKVADTESAGPAPDATASTRIAVASAIADADRLAEQGLFAQAISLLHAELGQAGDAAAVLALQQRRAALRDEALVAMNKLVISAKEQARQGGSRAAITMLALAQHHFPATEEFGLLAETLKVVEAGESPVVVGNGESVPAPGQPSVSPRTGAPTVDEPMRQATLSALRTQLDRVREAEASGAFGDMVVLLREAAGLARARDAEFATRLDRRAESAELLVAWHDAVAAVLGAGRKLHSSLRSGRQVELASTDGSRFVVAALPAEESATVRWAEIAPAALIALVEQVAPRGSAALGAAAMLYGAGEGAAAEALLARTLRADATAKAGIDRIIADGRGERFDERGYNLIKDGFVSVRSIEQRKEADRIASRIDGVARNKDHSARDQFVTDLLARGPDALDAMVLAFQKDLALQIEKLEKGTLRKQLDRLAVQRTELDKLRKHAKDLIYDEVEYFYPYKPPAVTGDRHAQYNRVQAEVDRRVADVQKMWRDDRLQIKVPASLRADLNRLDWVSRVLADLGSLDRNALAAVDWARALPVGEAGEAIGIADFCFTPTERAEVDEWRHIEAYNRTVEKELSSSVRELLRITNDYRMMFRHRPLAISPLVCTASQGHAEEMSRLGYFAHMSPTPGRRTPFDRMKLAGYAYGASENIALTGSAMGSHVAWVHSSGHHRNLLNPRHRELGIGADGHNWVQNFGGGSTYEADPAWLKTAAK